MGAGTSASEVAERKRAKARQLEEDARRWERGAEGERQIASVLAGLPPDYVVFHDLQLPASKANVDHLVIAPHGVYAVDTKNFTHPVTLGRGRGADKLWTGRRPVRLEACKWEASTTASLIGVDVTPMMCVIAPALPEPAFDFDGVRVCDPTRLLSNITNRGTQVIDVDQMVERVTTVFDTEPELREASASSPQPVLRGPSTSNPQPELRKASTSTRQPAKMVRPPVARPSRTTRRASLLRPLLVIAGLLGTYVLWPTIMPVITDAVAGASQRYVNDMASSTDSTSPTTTVAAAGPPVVTIEASCPTPGNGWVISFGWPGDLPVDASAYSVRSQIDDGPITRHDIDGWTDPAEPPAEMPVPDGASLRVITDVLDDEGHIVASTPQLFDAAGAC